MKLSPFDAQSSYRYHDDCTDDVPRRWLLYRVAGEEEPYLLVYRIESWGSNLLRRVQFGSCSPVYKVLQTGRVTLGNLGLSSKEDLEKVPVLGGLPKDFFKPFIGTTPARP